MGLFSRRKEPNAGTDGMSGTENPDGAITEGYLGNDNEWYEKGSNRRTIISQGYVKFHDYNF